MSPIFLTMPVITERNPASPIFIAVNYTIVIIRICLSVSCACSNMWNVERDKVLLFLIKTIGNIED